MCSAADDLDEKQEQQQQQMSMETLLHRRDRRGTAFRP